MIPKIIHFCWLSGDGYPKLIEQCLATWKTKLPDYEFMLWDTNKFDVNSTFWTRQAFESKKYAFAADYIRLHAIYNYGGIYLDTDVEVLKNFDDLLHLPYFIGLEQNDIIEAAVFGAEKGADWIADCMHYYDNRAFIKEDGTPDLIILPNIMEAQIEQNRKFVNLEHKELANIEKLIKDTSKLILYPYDFFSAKNHESQDINKTKNTYTIHHFNNAWVSKRKKNSYAFKTQAL
ncbi:MAG: glycosyltransferase [Urechidicola sp.]|nr:glycosyltransferase [Urechidicola sp.]